jgi:excinuclease ABC subunit A
VTVQGRRISDVTALSVRQAETLFAELRLSAFEHQVADKILREISVGLDYLTLERASATLSGGEGQRIRLATQIGSGLVGVLYILDEPSIGLHQRDNQRLLASLQRLRDLGNTVLVVEHDRDSVESGRSRCPRGAGSRMAGIYRSCKPSSTIYSISMSIFPWECLSVSQAYRVLARALCC